MRPDYLTDEWLLSVTDRAARQLMRKWSQSDPGRWGRRLWSMPKDHWWTVIWLRADRIRRSGKFDHFPERDCERVILFSVAWQAVSDEMRKHGVTNKIHLSSDVPWGQWEGSLARDDIPSPDVTPALAMWSEMRAERVRVGMKWKARLFLSLYFIEGMSYQEIASLWGYAGPSGVAYVIDCELARCGFGCPKLNGYGKGQHNAKVRLAEYAEEQGKNAALTAGC